jgi:hypothetical protein
MRHVAHCRRQPRRYADVARVAVALGGHVACQPDRFPAANGANSQARGSVPVLLCADSPKCDCLIRMLAAMIN